MESRLSIQLHISTLCSCKVSSVSIFSVVHVTKNQYPLLGVSVFVSVSVSLVSVSFRLIHLPTGQDQLPGCTTGQLEFIPMYNRPGPVAQSDSDFMYMNPDAQLALSYSKTSPPRPTL